MNENSVKAWWQWRRSLRKWRWNTCVQRWKKVGSKWISCFSMTQMGSWSRYATVIAFRWFLWEVTWLGHALEWTFRCFNTDRYTRLWNRTRPKFKMLLFKSDMHPWISTPPSSSCCYSVLISCFFSQFCSCFEAPYTNCSWMYKEEEY